MYKPESIITVFHDYNQELLIKSSQPKRSTSQVTAADVVLTKDLTLATTQEIFFRNTRNEDQLIKALLV